MPPLRNTMREKLHSYLCNRWFLSSVNLKFSPALLVKTAFVLDPLISDTSYFQHSRRAAASPVLLAFYSVPESILAQLPDIVVVYTYNTQSNAVNFSRINHQNALWVCLFTSFVCLFFKSWPCLLCSSFFLVLFSKLSILFHTR